MCYAGPHRLHILRILAREHFTTVRNIVKCKVKYLGIILTNDMCDDADIRAKRGEFPWYAIQVWYAYK